MSFTQMMAAELLVVIFVIVTAAVLVNAGAIGMAVLEMLQ